jgi:hypothetical protein
MDEGDYGARSFHRFAYHPIFLHSSLDYISQPKADFTNDGLRVVISTSICVKQRLYRWRETDWRTGGEQ